VAHFIENSRNHCALLGAAQSVQAISGFVPILHSTSGCGMQQYLGMSKVGGLHCSAVALPSTNVLEKQIVFGGASRLREQIKNTVKIVQAEAYVVLSGCATELVGDDAPAMVKEAKEQGYPVIHIASPGFKGDVYKGYEAVVKGMIEHLADFTVIKTGTTAGLVNILGIIPGQDIFWQGELLALENLLNEAGLQVNTLFGIGQTVQNWAAIPNAEWSIVFSPWGKKPAQYLQDKFGIPYWELPHLPVGFEDTYHFLQSLSTKLKIQEENLKRIYEREEKRQAYYLNRVADIYFAAGIQKEFAIVGEHSLVLGLQRFFTHTLGMLPKVLVFTDNLAVEEQKKFLDQLSIELAPFKTAVVFQEDQQQILEAIRQSKTELLLGSSLEKSFAQQQEIPFLPVSFPVTDQIILNKSYIGFNGAMVLLEDLIRQMNAMEPRTIAINPMIS
jgi:nitrogenase molybdenum-iron protein beta chain